MFVSGYRNVVVLIPEREKSHFTEIEFPERTKIVYVKEYGNGYLYQQVCKIKGHLYSDAEFIMFADSDCIFDHPVNVQDMIVDGKVDLLYTDYAKVGDAICWKKPTEDFIKKPVDYEFMRRNCLMYLRSTLENISNFEPNLEYNIMTSQSFSEYNAIGAYIWFYEKDKYNFINTDDLKLDPSIQNVMPIAVQLWSYADKNNNSEYHKTQYARSIETINRVFRLNITHI